MVSSTSKNIAVIGAGISGIGAANILQKMGHKVIVYEKSAHIGGVWAVAYPDVRLQNTWHQYHFADLPWTFKPDLHPTGAQILRYLQDAIDIFRLDVRLEHEIVTMKEAGNGWSIQVKHGETTEETFFDYVVIAIGQYTEGKYRPSFPGEKDFKGGIFTERDIKDLTIFNNKQVVVVGFGKSALDMATLAVKNGAQVQHVFRTPRWLIPNKILGLHFTLPLFSRFGSVMMTSWAHPTPMERTLHKQLRFIVSGFWAMLTAVLRLQANMTVIGKNTNARDRLKKVLPTHGFLPDLRSAAALAPKDYYNFVAQGKIEPHHAQLADFVEQGVKLDDNGVIPCDLAILSLGSKSPSFPFLPENYRHLLESEEDGAQLYRHLIHPKIPNLGFAGFNHGFLHVPSVEVGTLWLCALFAGELKLPSVEEMEHSIKQVQQWKRDHIHFEPSRSCAVSTRYQQYLDILLKDLGLSPYRKGWNIPAEVFARYGAHDYRHVVRDFQQSQSKRQQKPLAPLPVDT